MTRVLVTGASGGIGKEVYHYLKERAYQVEGHCYRTPNSDCVHSYYDLTKEGQVSNLVEKANPEVLIHCIGTNRDGLSWKLSNEDWDTILDTNLKSAFFLAKYIIPRMKEREFGRIIFISSILASMGVAGTSAYSASKAGLEGLTRALAAETTKYGITVNCIAPGYLDKGMPERVPKNILEGFTSRIPLGKLGPTLELCDLVQFLIDSSWCTGQIFHLDGGTLALR